MIKVVNHISAPGLESFDKQKLFHFIEFGRFSIYSTIYHAEQKLFVDFKSFSLNDDISELDFNDLITFLPELELLFARRMLLFQQRKFTLLPEEFYEAGIENDIIKLNFQIEDDEINTKDFISNLNAYLISSISQKTLKLLELIKYDALMHSFKPYIKSIHFQKNDSISKKLFLQVNSDFIIIVVKDSDNSYLLINSFPVKADEDIFYHLMNVITQTGFNPDKDSVYISGNYNKISVLFGLIYKHIRYPFTQKLNQDSAFHPVFENFFTHYFHNLFSTVLCV